MPARETEKERTAEVLKEWLANKNRDLTWLTMCMRCAILGYSGSNKNISVK
jgi:hypothetical protein